MEALKLHEAGYSVIPVKDKRPIVSTWASYQKEKPTDEEFKGFDFTNGMALIATRGVFCIDLDVKYDKTGLISRFKELVRTQDSTLLGRLFLEKTPSGGFHLVGKCAKTIGNMKLAKDAGQVEACIETRGAGGYFVVSPSKGYSVIKGDLVKLPEITPSELDIIVNSAKAVNTQKPQKIVFKGKKTEITPLNDYDEKNGWQESLNLILDVGWSVHHKTGDTTYLIRPGKQDKGCSASLNHYPNVFWCWSSNSDFEPMKAYTPAAVLAVIKYGGDFSACAKDLFREGYGSKTQITEQKAAPLAECSQIEKEMLSVVDGTFCDGLPTGWDTLYEYFRVSDFQLNIITGIPTHGKSTWLDQLFVQLANLHGWHFLIYSPESYPLKIHYRSLGEKLLKQNLYGIHRDKAKIAAHFIEEHFSFIDCFEDEISLDSILERAKKQNIKGLMLDPWNEIQFNSPSGVSETDYVRDSLTKMRNFARKYNTGVWLVVHPQKQLRDEKGRYKVPELYDCHGSAHFFNKADNGIVIYQNLKGECEVHIKKVKLANYGKKGMVKLKYLSDWRGYEDFTDRDEQENFILQQERYK